MPNRDGTGPGGRGPRTGRGKGSYASKSFMEFWEQVQIAVDSEIKKRGLNNVGELLTQLEHAEQQDGFWRGKKWTQKKRRS